MVASRKFKKGGQKKIPVVEARPVMGSEGNNLPIAKATKILNRIKKGGNWMTINNWLMVSKLITVVGLLIFSISTATKNVDGEFQVLKEKTIFAFLQELDGSFEECQSAIFKIIFFRKIAIFF